MPRVYADRVAEITTTVGTGDLALGGALPGYQSFNTVCNVGDTFDYSAFHVDGNGVPTGEWETGRGTAKAGGTIGRVPQQSSNGNALVNFTAGNKVIIISENAASIVALAAGGGGGGGGGMAFAINGGPTWGQDTSQNGVPIPNSTWNVNIPADGYYVITYNIHYTNSHRVRFNMMMDGARLNPGNASDGAFDYASYSENVSYMYSIKAATLAFLTAGAHVISTAYNAMDSTDQGSTNGGSFISLMPVAV